MKANTPFYNSVTYPCPMHGRCVRWPLEGAVKVVGTIVGMVAELFASTNYGSAGKVVYMGDLQHVTMYAFFCLSGIVDIVSSYDKVPKGLDYLASALAFAAEGILFKFHLHGRDLLDVTLHTLLVYVIGACVVTTLLEMQWRQSVMAALVRAFFVFLQGTWFIQVGFILYNPIHGAKHWDQKSHDSQVIAAMVFAWHLLGVFLAMAGIAILSRLVYKTRCRPTTEDIAYELLSSSDDDTASAEEILMEVEPNHMNYNMEEIEEGREENDDDPYSQISTKAAVHAV